MGGFLLGVHRPLVLHLPRKLLDRFQSLHGPRTTAIRWLKNLTTQGPHRISRDIIANSAKPVLPRCAIGLAFASRMARPKRTSGARVVERYRQLDEATMNSHLRNLQVGGNAVASSFQGRRPAYDRERVPGHWGQAFRYTVRATRRPGCRIRRRALGFWTVKDVTGCRTFPCGDHCQRALTRFRLDTRSRHSECCHGRRPFVELLEAAIKLATE